MRGWGENFEIKEATIGNETIETQQEALQQRLDEAVTAGNEAHIKYYTARLNEMQEMTPQTDSGQAEVTESVDDAKIGSSWMANHYREQAAQAAIELGKTSNTYRDLLKKAELEEMKD